MDQPPARAATPQLLVVAGSGRSGTSLFTGLTSRLGVYVPKPEVAANRSNPRGFGEPRWAVDFHKELLASARVDVDDGRPRAWHRTARATNAPQVRDRLRAWLEEQFSAADRVVVKDPRLAWFLDLYEAVTAKLGVELKVVTLLREPPEVIRSREVAYGNKTATISRVAGWLNVMLEVERRTRVWPRAFVRYQDLLDDWQLALTRADGSLELGLLDRADPKQIAYTDQLVDRSLRRSVVTWQDMQLPTRLLSLTQRTYATLDTLVETRPDVQEATRRELDGLRTEYIAYYLESRRIAESSVRAARREEPPTRPHTPRQVGSRPRRLWARVARSLRGEPR